MTSTTQNAVGPRRGLRKDRPARELAAEAYQALAAPLVVLLARLRVAPPAVVLVHAAAGLAAAAAIVGGALLLGAGLLQLKSLLDNADGQLARASGRISALGRYLDTEADLLVNAALFAALGVAAGAPWLAAAAFCSLTLILSADHAFTLAHCDAHGAPAAPPPSSGSVLERALVRVYGAVFAPQDRFLRGLSERRLRRILAADRDDAGRRAAALAYHDRGTAVVLANLGLSTQLLVVGVCLALGQPELALWLVAGSALALPLLQARREALARRALR